jgi:hypothetical protein
MAMSKRNGGEKQEDIWIAHTELAVAPGHPFYTRLNDLLEGTKFDEFVEGLCARFYHVRLGRLTREDSAQTSVNIALCSL